MAPFSAVDEDALLLFDEDLAVPVGLAAAELDVELELELVGGAAFARDTTLFHLAAEFALVSLGLTNKYDTSPWLSS